MIRLCRLATALVLVAAAAPVWAGGATVVAVELRADAPIETPGLRELVVARVGEPLDGEEVRRSLRNLQASGAAGAVEALALPAPGGVRLVFALASRVRVEGVVIEGDPGLRRAVLKAALPQTAAAPLSENRVLRGVFRLQDLYRAAGYGEATVRVGVDVEGRTARVIYRVAAGPRTTVGEIGFEGLPADLPAEALARRLRLRPGVGLEETRVEDDLERLTAHLYREGYRTATVGAPRRQPGTDPYTVDLVYPVVAGPRIELHVTGADLDRLRRRKLLEAFETERYDEALLLATVRAIRRDLQKRGHYRARVSSSVERGDEALRVGLGVVAGPRYELVELDFRGNESLTDAALEARAETSVGAGLRPGRLVEDLLAEDLENLRAYYALEGFWQASVGPPEVLIDGTSLRVGIPIVEGPRRLVADLRVEGLPPAVLAPVSLPLVADGPFHPSLVVASVDGLRAALEAAGYLSAQVSSKLVWHDETRVEVDLRVLAGPRALIDRIVVRGNRRTSDLLVRRALELEPGMPLSREVLLEAQRRLYRLGVFSRAEVRMAPAPPFAGRRDVLVRLTEGETQRLSYGLGYDSEDGLRGLAGYSHANIDRGGVSARFDLLWSEREKNARLAFRQPYVGRWRLPVTYSLFAVNEIQESFESRRRGFQLQAERILGKSDYGLLYTYKMVELEDTDPALQPLEIDRELREVEISSFTPSYFRDLRDDPLLPTRGWTAGLQTELAFPVGAADVEFLKLFAQHSRFVPLRRYGVLAGSLRLGAIEPLGGFLDPTLPSSVLAREIPISERFFGGGRNSHRAYRRDRLGVTGETVLEVPDEADPAVSRRVEVGGNGLLLANLDYRFPIAGPLGGTVFADLGNVWGDWRDLDLGELKTGAGLGLRYLSPIGPLRLEVGWKLDREGDEDPSVIFLSFGNPF